MKPSPKKIRAASISVATATSLALVKLVAGIVTGSMAVLASAIDSFLDILMSGVNFMAIRQAEQPADENHPFGHGKFETVATLFQSLIIAASGSWILFESSRRLLRGVELEALSGGMTILAISSGVSLWISRYLRRTAEETDSSALEADSLHFAMDVYTNLALFAGLAVIVLFDLPWLDPFFSMLVGCYILFEALRLVRRALRDVLDEELPEQLRHEVTDLIEAHKEDLLDFHSLRTRRAGSQKIMDFHLTVCKDMTVGEAHAIADHLEKRIQEKIRGADVIIHIEPCGQKDCHGPKCPMNKARLEKDRKSSI